MALLVVCIYYYLYSFATPEAVAIIDKLTCFVSFFKMQKHLMLKMKDLGTSMEK
jgi:hypothetical protein